MVFVFMFYTEISSALIISEIEFDPAGSDTDREWIEIFNDTNASVDLTTYKFFEANTNHGIDILSGDKNVASGEYVVLVQDLDKWKADFPSYTGKIFKSSFSLSNTGELLSLKDSGGNVLNTVTYSPSATGAGNGSTINYNGSGYVKADPTPGSGNLSVSTTVPPVDNGTTTDTVATSTATTTDDLFVAPTYYSRSYWPESEKIYLNAGENKIGISGGDVIFEGRAVTGDKKPVTNATFFWNFGDGENGEGKTVTHIYKYPGEYTVDIEAYSSGNKRNGQIFVKIVDPELKIKLKDLRGDKVVEVANNGKDAVDIGGYIIKTTGGEFEFRSTLGKHLSIMPKKIINISQSTLKFATSTTKVVLMYPDGKEITGFSSNEKLGDIPKVADEVIIVPVGSTTATVYTREEFDRLQNLAINEKPVQKKTVASYKPKITVPNSTTSSPTSQKFIVKNEDIGIVSSLLKYFGI